MEAATSVVVGDLCRRGGMGFISSLLGRLILVELRRNLCSHGVKVRDLENGHGVTFRASAFMMVVYSGREKVLPCKLHPDLISMFSVPFMGCVILGTDLSSQFKVTKWSTSSKTQP